MNLLKALLHVFEVAAGMFIVLGVWLGVQNFVRRKSGCGRDRDMLDFMLHGCGGCANSGICTKGRKDGEHHNLYDYDFSNLRLATVLATERITPPNDPVEVRHLVLEVPEERLDYLEGQSIAVLVPGPHEFGGAYHFRLYSIASPRRGEDGKADTFSICVRRCFYIDEVSGERYPGAGVQLSLQPEARRPGADRRSVRTAFFRTGRFEGQSGDDRGGHGDRSVPRVRETYL